MINGVIALASYGSFGGGSIGNLLAQWEAVGVFDFVLPFLLIFAIIFVVLSNVAVFKDNKGVNAIISLAVALMSLQFNIVGMFFAEIFPRLGVALSIILVVVVLGSLFIDPKKHPAFTWIFAIMAFVIMGVVIFSSLEVFNFGGASNIGSWLRYNGQNLVIIAVSIGLLVWAVVSASPESKTNVKGLNLPFLDKD